MVDYKTGLTSREIRPISLVHYQPITPASHYYTGNSNEKSINNFPISTTNMINSTNTAGIVQPVSLVHYQPIVAAGSEDPIISTNSAVFQHASTINDGHHSSTNDNSHDGGSHSDSTHQKSSSNHDNNDQGGGTRSHHSDSHHRASASASAG